ncbi:hypothetical protein [Paracoccus rhizosphaerae]|uniref:Uncharacterized protein n=1 Tax=Paracoccus rhizosphaerae TaxID=1133347 RepID=A0ABV6CPL2_9RHOB|nr:hypothetical protein [Paracoccus rhizosphaerae]
MARLTGVGLIRGYRAEIVLERTANVTHVIVTVSLAQQLNVHFVRLKPHIRALAEITERIATGGGNDNELLLVSWIQGLGFQSRHLVDQTDDESAWR